MPLDDCRLIDLPKIGDNRGNLSFIQKEHIPFEIKRVFYIYEVPEAQGRGAHGHKTLEEFIVPLSGCFDFSLDDGFKRTTFTLNRPNQGLYVPAMMWSELKNFTDHAVCLVLASDIYKESDYFRDYTLFMNAVMEQQHAKNQHSLPEPEKHQRQHR